MLTDLIFQVFVILRFSSLIINECPWVILFRPRLLLFLQLMFEHWVEIICQQNNFIFNNIKKSIWRSIEHWDKPLSSFCTCRTQIHFKQPSVQFLVQHEIEPIYFKTVVSMFYSCFLSRSNCFNYYFLKIAPYFT